MRDTPLFPVEMEKYHTLLVGYYTKKPFNNITVILYKQSDTNLLLFKKPAENFPYWNETIFSEKNSIGSKGVLPLKRKTNIVKQKIKFNDNTRRIGKLDNLWISHKI